MKKFLSILLVVVLCLTGLIACGKNNAEDAAALEDAATYLNTMYKDKATNTPNDYDVVAKVVVNGKSYSVTWTTSDERVTVKEKSASFWTIDVPDVVTEEISYTLTATITDANGNTAQKSFNRVVPIIDKGGITNDPEEGVAYKLYMNQATLQQKFYALTKTQNNENKFIETTNNPKEAPDFFIEKVDGGVKIYTMVDGAKTYVYAKTTTAADGKVSKYIGYSTENSTVFNYVQTTNSWQTAIDGTTYVFGTYSTYKTFCISEASYITAENTGVSQFVMEFMTKAHAESLAPDEEVKVEVPAANSTLTITEANELGLKVIGYTEGKYYVTGIVDEIANTTYGNIYIKDAAGNRLYVYGIYTADGSVRFDAMETQPKVGDTITVYGIVGNYNGAAQMKNGWVTALSSEGGSSTPETPETPAAPITSIAEALEAASGANVVLTGTVVSMYEDWSSYGNCSPYIQDADGNKILVFRTTTKVHVGDVITVTGTITVYNSTNQIAQGATAVIVTEHTHTYSDATCTAAPACNSCGASNGEGALGHTEANAEGKCDRCGIDLAASYTDATISFADKANRTEFTDDAQVWVQNGITVTNNKHESTNPIADYSNPARFYANTNLVIEASNIAKIVFDCNNATYANNLKAAIEAAEGVTVTVSNDKVTVEFTEVVDSFTIAKLTGQVRMDAITVTSKA